MGLGQANLVLCVETFLESFQLVSKILRRISLRSRNNSNIFTKGFSTKISKLRKQIEENNHNSFNISISRTIAWRLAASFPTEFPTNNLSRGGLPMTPEKRKPTKESQPIRNIMVSDHQQAAGSRGTDQGVTYIVGGTCGYTEATRDCGR